MRDNDFIFVDWINASVQTKNAQANTTVFQYNTDPMGDLLVPEPIPIKLSQYQVHTIVSGSLLTNDKDLKTTTVNVFRSYKINLGQVFTYKPVIYNYTLSVVNKNIKEINANVFRSYRLFLGQIVAYQKSINTYTLPVVNKNIQKINANIYRSYRLPLNQIYTVKFGRLNSNIYKNIFTETVTDIEYISKIKDNVRTSEQDIIQENHGFDLYDAVYLDSNSQYQKGLAENTEKALIKGIITRITNKNIFTLMNIGKSDYMHLDYQDTSFLYLSDKIPGKLVHYTEITNTVYVPLAVYANDSIIINLQEGSAGDTMIPYVPPESLFDEYTQEELDNTIGQIILAV